MDKKFGHIDTGNICDLPEKEIIRIDHPNIEACFLGWLGRYDLGRKTLSKIKDVLKDMQKEYPIKDGNKYAKFVVKSMKLIHNGYKDMSDSYILFESFARGGEMVFISASIFYLQDEENN